MSDARAELQIMVHSMMRSVDAIMRRDIVGRNMRMGVLGVMALLALSVKAEVIRAQSPIDAAAIRAHLTVDASEGCATAATLAKRVQQRSSRIEFVDDNSGVPQIGVEIVAQSALQLVVKLYVQWPDGQHSERQLTAQSCDSGVDALALLLAMTLDPGMLAEVGMQPAFRESEPEEVDGAKHAAQLQNHSTQAEAAPSEPAPAADGAAAEAAIGATATDPNLVRDAPTGAKVAETEPGVDPAAISSGSPPHPFGIEYLAAGVEAQLASQVAPGATLGLGIYAQLALEGIGLWAPALALQIVHSWASQVEESGGHADFELDAIELGACPAGVRLGTLAVRTCLVGAVGRLIASGSLTYLPQEHRRPWGSVGSALLLSVGLARWVELQGGVELVAPMFRYGFEFRPEVFHRIPAIYFCGHLGVGMRFP